MAKNKDYEILPQDNVTDLTPNRHGRDHWIRRLIFSALLIVSISLNVFHYWQYTVPNLRHWCQEKSEFGMMRDLPSMSCYC